MNVTSPISPSRIFWIRACRAGEWRHCSPAAIFTPFFSASSPAASSRFRPTGSGENGFSMKTLIPFLTAYST